VTRRVASLCAALLIAAPIPALAQSAAPLTSPSSKVSEVAESAGRSDDPVTRRAPNVDLDAPVSDRLLDDYLQDVDRNIEHRSNAIQDDSLRGLDNEVDLTQLRETTSAPFYLLGVEVPAGTATRLAWQPGESFVGIAVPTPVLVVHGAEPGPVVCLTAAVHGDELNGIEMVRRVLYDLDAGQLKGTVIGVPIVNLLGFKRSSRYLPDRRDLNRYFPGNPRGSSASRIADSFFREIVVHCSVLVDLHTGSFYRTNLPQLRADLRRKKVANVARSFASTAIVHSAGVDGSLRRAAVTVGIPSVTLEVGEPMRLDSELVDHGVRGIQELLDQMGMYSTLRVWGNPAPVHYQSRWVRADTGGILLGQVKLGQRVTPGHLLGTVTDPITNMRADIISPHEGRVIGLAVNQVVQPGFAAFHIGIETRADELYEPEPAAAPAVEGLPLPSPAEPELDIEAEEPEADRMEDS
jgi:uncharacterized protein